MLALYLGVIGAALGSFVTAMVWRLRTGRTVVMDRSRCEGCLRPLPARDLIPLVSWLLLRGRCRYCGVRIGVSAIVVEAALAAVFIVSLRAWPWMWSDPRAVWLFVLWLAFVVVLAALAVYDARWLRLPNRLLLVLVPFGLAGAALRVGLSEPFTAGNYVRHVLAGAAVLGGVYALAYLVSGGRWVGSGDIVLGASTGALLGWQGSLIALTVANALGVVVVLALVAVRRRRLHEPAPLGPFLAAGVVVAGLVPLA